jgi:septal ring factor EnvC (AmiA/AmiB activator)
LKNIINKILRIIGLIVLCGLLQPATLIAQNKKNLEDKRKKLTKEIEITSKLLDKTKQNKSAVYERFVTLQNQIERREDLIQTIENEIVESENIITRNTGVIAALNEDVSKMRAEYGQILRTSFRLKALNNPLMFLLSAENLNQAYRRWIFLRNYNKYRVGQQEAIAFTQSILSKKIVSLGLEKTEKEQLLMEMQGQKGTLTTELTDKNTMLQTLSTDEAKLRSELEEKQKTKAALDNSIERTIAEEERKKDEITVAKNKKKAAASPPPKAANPVPKPAIPAPSVPNVLPKPIDNPPKPVTEPAPKPQKAVVTEAPEKEVEVEDITSQSFQKLRGRLPWPVDGGFIARAYGKQKHPTLKNIEITNNGIDIRSSEEAPVRSVFEGKVAGVQYIPGHDYTVIIQHGNYYTVYSNLSETNLSKGDIVAAGSLVGKVSTNPISGAAELHFELWREKERLNPASWIK